LVRLHGRSLSAPRGLDEMTDLRKQKEEQAYVLWLETLRSRAIIKIDRNLLKKGVIPLDHEN